MKHAKPGINRGRFFTLFFFYCLFLPPAPALGAVSDVLPEPSRKAEELSLGVAVSVSTSPYKSYTGQFSVFPLVSYEGRHAYIRGFTAGIKVVNLENLECSVFAGYDDSSFDASDTSDRRLRLLKDRYPGVVAGVAARVITPYGVFQAGGAADVSGQSSGITGTFDFLLPLEYGPLEVIPSVGVRWNDRKYNNYYYGVSGNEAQRSGLDEYRSGSGFAPCLGLVLDYSITDNWEVFCHGEVAFLSHAVKDSPMVGNSRAQSLTLGVTYTF
ncbi:MAG: MipA/OmpV family protein [Deltaproteobacteria bacterium]|jgi:outer membrane scaffolding protein for murein synthesis (MipA/OmpV family)|nr:MipA/OmpV family protein [Deltaproteobacteria bacterium]